MTQLLVFDLGNVLWKVDHGDAWRFTLQHSHLDEAALMQRFYGSGDMIESMTGAMGDDEFFTRLSEKLEFRGSASDLRRVWTDVYHPFHDRLALIEELARYKRLAVLSNISPFHSRHLELEHPQMALFEHRGYSWQYGYMKPRQEAFKALAEACSVRPEDCLFIDDQAQHVEAARALGWQALTVSPDQDLCATLSPYLPKLNDQHSRTSNA